MTAVRKPADDLPMPPPAVFDLARALARKLAAEQFAAERQTSTPGIPTR